ncbi:MAG: helix-turn-helix domain-containing protein [Pseudanabaena sp. ELA607]|jgi:transcriptional regulator GlxA family with amidase domain
MFHVSLIALPNTLAGQVIDALDLFNAVDIIWHNLLDEKLKSARVFKAEIVSTSRDYVSCFAGINLVPHQSIYEIKHTDIIYLPSIIVASPKEILNIKYQEICAWICQMYDQGAIICSSGSGVLIMAETGLLDDVEATSHNDFIKLLQNRYPKVILVPNRLLVQSGKGQRLITVGGKYIWYDLILYLIARHAGNQIASEIAKVFSIPWHFDDQILAYASFQEHLQHDDAVIQVTQNWLANHIDHVNPITYASQIAGLSLRTFNRRFKESTGLTPIAYIQYLRIEKIKILLETTTHSIDDISLLVGYEDSSSLRLLFKRLTNMTPSEYRRKFKKN